MINTAFVLEDSIVLDFFVSRTFTRLILRRKTSEYHKIVAPQVYVSEHES